MPMLNDEIKGEVKDFLEVVEKPVRLIVFTQEFECEYCKETRELVQEVGALSDQLTVEVYDLVADKDKADELGVDKIPAIALIGAEDYGVRFFGIPSGYEFTSLLHAIRMVSDGKTELSDAALEMVAELDQPVHLQVFVTPTCPYCPQAVLLAHQLAIASPMVTGDMVEATEFPQLSVKYQVMGVPRTVINENVHIEGAAPEGMVLDKINEALQAA